MRKTATRPAFPGTLHAMGMIDSKKTSTLDGRFTGTRSSVYKQFSFIPIYHQAMVYHFKVLTAAKR